MQTKKNRTLMISLSAEEVEIIKNAAACASLSTSAYVRSTVLRGLQKNGL